MVQYDPMRAGRVLFSGWPPEPRYMRTLIIVAGVIGEPHMAGTLRLGSGEGLDDSTWHARSAQLFMGKG